MLSKEHRELYMEWMDVDATLPKDNVKVVGYFGRDDTNQPMIQVCYLEADRWYAFAMGEYEHQLVNPTHWLPLPAYYPDD